jgi:hypothetical protein
MKNLTFIKGNVSCNIRERAFLVRKMRRKGDAVKELTKSCLHSCPVLIYS